MAMWSEWLAAQRAASTMSVEPVPLREVGGGWKMQNYTDHYGRDDGKFFRLSGVRIKNAGREVTQWGQPMLKEMDGSGAVILLRSSVDTDCFLVAARQEPGNTTKLGYVLLGPSLQTSMSNLQQMHGGKLPPRAELLVGKTIEWVLLTMDGGRFIGKVNHYAVVEVDPSSYTLADNEIWLTRAELREAMQEGELNEHLALALLLAAL